MESSVILDKRGSLFTEYRPDLVLIKKKELAKILPSQQFIQPSRLGL